MADEGRMPADTIEQGKCGSCSQLVREMGDYCRAERQRLDMLNAAYFSEVLQHCGGPYPTGQEPVYVKGVLLSNFRHLARSPDAHDPTA